MEFRVYGSGFGVECLGDLVQVLLQGSGFRV